MIKKNNPLAEQNHLIFVYGSLKSNESNHRLLKGSLLVGEANTVKDYRLYDKGSYPCMVYVGRGKGKNIEGEVWQVDDAILTKLDVLEGVDYGLYVRTRIKLLKIQTSVWTYLYLQDISKLQESGTSWSKKRNK